MASRSRRTFLLAAGTVAIGAGAATAAQAADRPTGARAESGPARGGAPAPVLAFVTDPRRDEVTLMVDDREQVIRDRALARALTSAANQVGGR